MRINREYQLGGGITLKIAIENGVAIMISNFGKEMQKIYFKAKKAGKKNIKFDYRKNAMIENFTCKDEKFAEMLDIDFGTAKIEQAKAKQTAQKNIKEKKK